MSDALDAFVGEITLHVAGIATRLVDAISFGGPDRLEFGAAARVVMENEDLSLAERLHRVEAMLDGFEKGGLREALSTDALAMLAGVVLKFGSPGHGTARHAPRSGQSMKPVQPLGRGEL